MTSVINELSAEQKRSKTGIGSRLSALATAFPEVTAVESGIHSLSYKELDERSNKFADYLAIKGVQPGACVAIYMEHSIWLLVAVTGILKRGAIYVPLDHRHPVSRLKFMLQDCAARTLVTTFQSSSELPFFVDDVIEIDTDWAMITQTKTVNRVDIDSAAIACLIFTSGSTGLPKAVELSHHNIVSLAAAAQEQFRLTHRDRFLQIASISFSASLEEMFPALLYGATLVYAEDRNQLNAAAGLTQFIKNNAISVLELTTAHWIEVVNELDKLNLTLPGCCRLLIMGGERCSREDFIKWKKQHTHLIHVYGPSESSATATYYDAKHYDDTKTEKNWHLPIGKAIRGCSVYLLDDQLNEVNHETIGEIYLAGDNVAYGYRNRPSETAAVFIPDPFSTKKGLTMYKTGDLAKRLADNNLIYCGRNDFQIKFKGIRIDPQEIETQINRLDGVHRSIVRCDLIEGKEVLAAYLEADDCNADFSYNIKKKIGNRLPYYMLPSVVYAVNKFPLTVNKKVDFSKIKRQQNTGTYQINNDSNNLEEYILELWREYLKVSELTVEDNFYSSGGDSFIASQIAAKIHAELGFYIRPAVLFEVSSVSELSHYISNKNFRNSFDLSEIKSEREKFLAENEASVDIVGPLSFTQNAIWTHDTLSQYMGDNKRLYVETIIVQFNADINSDLFKQALESVYKKQALLGYRIAIISGRPVLVNDHGSLNLNCIDNSTNKNADNNTSNTIENSVQAFINEGLSLKQGPLFKVLLVSETNNCYKMVINVHHIVFDGLSLEILLKALSATYESLLANPSVEQPCLKYDYIDFAFYQRKFLTGRVYAQSELYWKNKLNSYNGESTIKADNAQPDLTNMHAGEYCFDIDSHCLTAIREFSAKRKKTLFMVLFSAFSIALAKQSEKTDLIIGTSVANRPASEFDTVIGPFINLLPLRITIDFDKSIYAFMDEVETCCLESYRHQDVPFERILDTVSYKNQFGRHPLFQVLFQLAKSPLYSLNDTLLNYTSVTDANREFSKYDIGVVIEEHQSFLHIVVDYSSALYKEDTVKGLMDEFITTLQAMINCKENKTINVLSENY